MLSDIPEEKKIIYKLKIVMLGDSGVGKTNILSRFTNNEFSLETKQSIGIEFQNRGFKIENQILNLQLWDIPGKES